MRRIGLAILSAFTVGVLAQAFPGSETPVKPDAEELRKQIDEQNRQLNQLWDELYRQWNPQGSPAWYLSGDWQLTEATQGGKPVTAPVSRLSFDGNRVRFKYRDSRGERVYSCRVDVGSPLPTLDLFEPGGTVTFGAFTVGDGKEGKFPVNVVVAKEAEKEVTEGGVTRKVRYVVYEQATQEHNGFYGTTLRLALDRTAGLRPLDLSGKDSACVVWVFQRDGAYRPPPQPETPSVPAPFLPLPDGLKDIPKT